MARNRKISKMKIRPRKKRTEKQQFYPADVLNRAVQQARITGKVREAARQHQVPYTTVHRYLKNPPKNTKPGPEPILLPEEEAKIEEWILYMSRAGFPISESDLTETVADYAEKIRKKRKIPDSFPSKNWSKRYLSRHPAITKKLITRLSKAGALVTKEQIINWFEEVEETLHEADIDLSIFDNPRRVFNFDESGFQPVPPKFKALSEVDVDNAYYVNNNSDKENYSMLFGSNADGDLAPPMIIYQGKRVTREIAENAPDGWSVGVADEGWQTCKTFYEYMVNVFYPWLLTTNVQFPVIVFLDGHKSHVSIELSVFCIEKGIILVALFPNSTRFLQPLDKVFFGPLKKIWYKVLKKFLRSKSDARVNKANFGKLMKTAVDSFSNSKECLKKGYRVCGICPWNVGEVDFSNLPSNVTVKNLNDDGPQASADVNEDDDFIGQQNETDFYVEQLSYVEKGLDETTLARFTENYLKDFWYGPMDELALFNFWKLIKDKSEGLMFTEPLILHGSLIMDYSIDENGNCVAVEDNVKLEQSAFDESEKEETVQNDNSINGLNETDMNVESEDPFDGVLIWPRVDDKTSGRKRKPQEHVPAVATSSKWLAWHNRKDKVKKEQEDAKQARIAQRKLQKQKKEEQKLMKKSNKENTRAKLVKK